MAKSIPHSPTRVSSGLIKNTLRFILTIPIIIVIIGALVIAFQAAVENLRYAQAKDQILTFVLVSKKYAEGQSSFAMQPGEDLLATLVRDGQIASPQALDKNARFTNPWLGEVKGVVVTPSVLRIESFLPTHDCRRMAMELIRAGSLLGLQSVEVRNNEVDWHDLYHETDKIYPMTERVIQVCGHAEDAVLAMTFHVRQTQ